MALTPTETRDLLARLGHRPKRFLGQNFLVDGNIVRKSVELARIEPGDAAVEIGPGLGTLTGALLEAGGDWDADLMTRVAPPSMEEAARVREAEKPGLLEMPYDPYA